MNKPVTILKEEFEEQLRNLINSSNLAPIILEPIFKETYENVRALYQKQLDFDKQRYYSSLREGNDDEADNEEAV